MIRPIVASIVGMPPPVALLFTIAFIIFLFRRDIRERPNVTPALWLPLLWMLTSCTRPLTEWLRIVGLPISGAVSVDEGSPLDACFYFVLIVAGFLVLNKRGFNLGQFVERNGWLVAFLLYCFLTIFWSDFPFVALKRWIKVLGLPIMALILFTEPDFKEAMTTLMKRCAYIFLTLSVLFIKYYPSLGRKFDDWTGLAVQRGAAQSKNMLGAGLMLLGLFLFWHLLQVWRRDRGRARRNELLLITALMLMIVYLFKVAQSATSMMCLLVGMMVIVALGMRTINKRYVGLYLLAAVSALAVAELMFGLSGYVIAVLHRNPTLTDRTTLWADLLKIKINPIFGVGFESFWLGDRLVQLHEGRAFQPNEAHNGYLETYLSLGLVGLSILIVVLIVAFRKIGLNLVRNFEWGRFQLGFLIALVLFNITEVSFRGPNTLWLVFYIVAIQYPKRESGDGEPTVITELPVEETELVHSFGNRI